MPDPVSPVAPDLAAPDLAAFDLIAFDPGGLVPAVAQQHDTGEVLMMAWMNRASVAETLATGRVCYWSRSRGALWRKGERSGQVQRLVAAHTQHAALGFIGQDRVNVTELNVALETADATAGSQ